MHVLVGRVYIFFAEMSTQVLDPFYDCLFIIKLELSLSWPVCLSRLGIERTKSAPFAIVAPFA